MEAALISSIATCVAVYLDGLEPTVTPTLTSANQLLAFTETASIIRISTSASVFQAGLE
jgi:hypothetical protein